MNIFFYSYTYIYIYIYISFMTIIKDQLNLIVTNQWSTTDVVHYSFLKSDPSNTAKVYCYQQDEMLVQFSKM